MSHPGTLISFWSLDHLDLTDALNEEIWRVSPARGVVLKVRLPLDRHGGLQDMNLGMLGGLPWVPDLVGRHWREPDSVLVVGSAYAPFIHPWAGRSAAMDARDYRDAKSAAEFLRRFVPTVVAGDRAYYEPIGELLSGITSPDRVVLTDLCRASFVRRDGPDKMTAGDAAVEDAPDIYGAYVEAGEDWTWTRIEQCTGRVIVALGNIAEQGLLEVFRRRGYALSIPAVPHVIYTPVRPGASGNITRPTMSAEKRRQAGWWWRAVRGDHEYRVAAVVHPSWRNRYDPGFVYSRELIISARTGVTPSRVAHPEQPKIALPILGPCAECGRLEGVEYHPEDPMAPNRRLLCLKCLVPAIRAEMEKIMSQAQEPCIRLESETDLPLRPRPIRLNGRDDYPGREWHVWVPREKGSGVGFILTWRASIDVPLSEADLVGYYLVNLEELKRSGHVRLDLGRRKNETGYRLRVVHRAKQIFIEQSGSEFFGKGYPIGTLDY